MAASSTSQAAKNGPHPPVAAVELAIPTPPTARNSTVPEPLTDDTTASGEPVQVTENSETSAADPSSRLFSEGDTGLPSILPAEHEQPQAWPMSDGVMPVNDDDDNNDNDVPRDSLVSRRQSQEGPLEAPLGDPDARVPLDEADPLHAAEMELLQLASEVAPIHELAEIQTPVDMHLTGKTMDFLDEVVASRKSCASPDDEGVMTETA